ncbi:MAG: GFA family protein [Myxococcales bacterium]|nr:GFA family protein [Myxococcales bacterium]
MASEMAIEGGCYCGALRYRVQGEPMFKGQCHCRECQYFAGGGVNHFMGVAADALTFTRGAPKRFQRSDLEQPVVRTFCGECGTQIYSQAPAVPALILKAGTLDDPSHYGGPSFATFTVDQQSYHHVPEGCRTFERMPG